MAIRIYSFDEAKRLKDKVPKIVLTISKTFQGNGYDSERDGYLIALEPNDDITLIKEIGEEGLFIDGVPTFEFVSTHWDGDTAWMEIVIALDSERTVAIFSDINFLDTDLLAALQKHSTPPEPMSEIKEVMP